MPVLLGRAPDSSVRGVIRGSDHRRLPRARAPSRDRHGLGGPFGARRWGGSRSGAVRCGQRVVSERTRSGTAWANASRQSRIGSPDGSGVGSRTAHSGGRLSRGQVLAGTSTTGTSIDVAWSTSRAQSARDARPPFTRWWIAGLPPLPVISASSAISSTIASARSGVHVGQPISSYTALRGVPATFARSAARAIFSGKSLPGGPWSHDVRTIASRDPAAASARISPLTLLAPYGLIGLTLSRGA